MTPAPRTRVPKGAVLLDGSRKPSEAQLIDGETDTEQNGGPRKMSMPEQGDSLRPATFMLRRRSTGNKSTDPLRADDPEVMKHLKHLGPSNAANRPKSTRINTVKIKPGQTSSPAPEIPATIPENARPASQGILAQASHAPEGGIGEGLLSSAAGEASDGVHSLAVGYGTMAAPSGDRMSWKDGKTGIKDAGEDAVSPGAQPFPSYAEVAADGANDNNEDQSRGRRNSHSTIGSLHSGKSQSPPKKRHTARSGSISQNIIDVNGIKKIVLETTSSSDSDDKLADSQADVAEDSRQQSEDESPHPSKGESKKKRKKRGKKKNKGGNSSESQPLLGNQ
jgi:metal transporter CNNM